MKLFKSNKLKKYNRWQVLPFTLSLPERQCFYQKFKETKKKSKSRIVFRVIYWVGIIFLMVCGFLNMSYFAYDAVNNLGMTIAIFVVMVALLITCLVDDLLKYKKGYRRWQAYITYLGTGFLLVARLFLSFKVWYIIAFILYLAQLLAVTLLWVKFGSMRKTVKIDRKIYCVLALMAALFILNVASQNYLDYMIGAWALIPAAVISIAAIALLFTVFKKLFFKLSPKVSTRVGFIFLVVMFSFMVGWCGLDVINTTFSPAPVYNNYEIVDKHIDNASSRGDTTDFIITVIIDGREVNMDVSSSTYYEKEIGDTLRVGFYEGGLGFGFYEEYIE